MALGGGVWISQNKKLPGAYINFVSVPKISVALGERGIVAIALPLNHAAGTVITITRSEFVNDTEDILGVAYTDASLLPLREIFCNATKVHLYDLGEDGTVSDALAALEPYEFNVLCAYTATAGDVTSCITQIKSWRDDYGKKCQLVVYNQTTPDHEGVINVISTVDTTGGAPAHALTAWVAGAEAACAVNASCTNKLYNGELDVICDKTQAQLETTITDGQIAFHEVYGDVRLLRDINSLTTFTGEKSEDFSANQTIRVLDQIANDIAKLFNTKYLGKVQNTQSNRVGLWGDIVAHHRELERIQAIEDFNADELSVEAGQKKNGVVVNDVVKPAGCMEQLYMTVVLL